MLSPRAACGAALVPFLLLLGPASAERPRRDRFDAVVIDAGHGGEDHGALGEGGLVEKELVLDVAIRLARRLRQNKLRVVLTRQDDLFVPLEERTSVANDARADLFISIHANSARSGKAQGMETYFVSLEASDELSSQVARRENDAFGARVPAAPRLDPLSAILGDMAVNEHVRESSGFAKLAQGELARIDSVPSRGIKQAPFVVLMGVRMPATLIEIGFLSNAADERALRTRARRDAIADALTRAVVAFGVDYDRRRGVAETEPSSDVSGEAPARSGRTGLVRWQPN